MPHKRQGHPHRKHASKAIKVPVVSARPARDWLDYMVYFFSIATPLSELPQAITIFSNKSAADVSIATWSFFLLDNVVWIAYAVKRKILPLFITTVLYLIVELTIVIGILLYA